MTFWFGRHCKYFFESSASTNPTKEALVQKYKNYTHYDEDIRNYFRIKQIFEEYKNSIELIIHTAAQPSHDWAAKEPLTDFSINANGTMNLLELTRLLCPNATFIFTSTNKVYGDAPNFLNIKEEFTRHECYDAYSNLY
jgi:CDP-paratose 2-epimerase